MGKWFNENMSSNELGMAFCSLTEKEYKANKKEIKKEYAKVLPVITKRESDLAKEGWML